MTPGAGPQHFTFFRNPHGQEEAFRTNVVIYGNPWTAAVSSAQPGPALPLGRKRRPELARAARLEAPARPCRNAARRAARTKRSTPATDQSLMAR